MRTPKILIVGRDYPLKVRALLIEQGLTDVSTALNLTEAAEYVKESLPAVILLLETEFDNLNGEQDKTAGSQFIQLLLHDFAGDKKPLLQTICYIHKSHKSGEIFAKIRDRESMVHLKGQSGILKNSNQLIEPPDLDYIDYNATEVYDAMKKMRAEALTLAITFSAIAEYYG